MPKVTQVEVKTTFGPRKMDPEKYAKQKGAKSRTATSSGVRFGRRKDPAVTPAELEQVAEAEEKAAEGGGAPANPFLVVDGDSVHRLSIAKTEELLVAKPELLEQAIATEFQLEHGSPRKGAVQLFKDIEDSREAPRQRILDLLKTAGAE